MSLAKQSPLIALRHDEIIVGKSRDTSFNESAFNGFFNLRLDPAETILFDSVSLSALMLMAIANAT